MKRSTPWFFALIAVFIGSFFLTGCDLDDPRPLSSAQQEMKQNEETQQRQMKAVPAPQLKTSLERKNLVRRLERINTEEMVSYIYLLDYGKVISYYTIRGKVSSLNTYLTAMERLQKLDSGSTNYGPTYVTLEAPDLDGTYGKNVDGIFFFTTEGAYMEWNGKYLWSDQPHKVTQQPELVQMVGEGGTK